MFLADHRMLVSDLLRVPSVVLDAHCMPGAIALTPLLSPLHPAALGAGDTTAGC
jgi:hypothetical protein